MKNSRTKLISNSIKHYRGWIIVLFIIGITLTIPSYDWSNPLSIFGFISIVISTMASIFALFLPTKFIYSFDEKDWSEGGEDKFFLKISFHEHGIGKSPQIQVFIFEENLYKRITTSSACDNQGNVIISSMVRFKGKVNLRS